MKKLGIILALIIVLTISCTFTSVCFAASDVGQNACFYEVTNTQGLRTYIKDGDQYKESIIIPYSYFFKISGPASNGYFPISYNEETLYIIEATSASSIALSSYDSESSFSQSPYYQLSISASNAIYFYDADFVKDSNPQNCSSIKFVGYILHEDTYYFLAKAKINVAGTDLDITKYVLSSDVLSTTFNPANITIHPDSKQARDEEDARNVELAQNKLRRNIFFFAICVVCVVVVLLIYNPFKKKQSKKMNSNMSAEEEF